MDFDSLVKEIVARVQAKMSEGASPSAAKDSSAAACAANGVLPKLLVLNSSHGECCHKLLENSFIKQRFITECALMKNYELNAGDYGVVVAFSLDNQSLMKLGAGIADTPYLSVLISAILLGKTVYIVKDEVELFSFEKTAPPAYYAMMYENVRLLERSGVRFCQIAELEGKLLGSAFVMPSANAGVSIGVSQHTAEAAFSKKVITEHDVKNAYSEGAGVITVPQKAVLTELAKEFIYQKGITVVRR